MIMPPTHESPANAGATGQPTELTTQPFTGTPITVQDLTPMPVPPPSTPEAPGAGAPNA